VRKTGISTTEAASRLARATGIKASSISWSGLKDKQGVCRQWFSIHSPGKDIDNLQRAESDALIIEQQLRNNRKLRRGSHKCNHFVIRLTDLRPLDANTDMQAALADLEQRLEMIGREGVPNYFGEQRFGFSNLEDATAFFCGQKKPRDRQERGMWLSAARSAIFNAVLARRVADRSWNQYLMGDVMNLDGSGSVFTPDSWDDILQHRLTTQDIHPTGPLWGEGELRTTAQARDLELAVARSLADFADALPYHGLQQARRSLRLPVKVLHYSRPALLQAGGTAGNESAGTVSTGTVSTGAEITISFSLPPGSYATAVLHELLVYDQGRDSGA
jgi:tRNA pseudouridine13 synthase